MTKMDASVTYIIRRGLTGPIKVGTSRNPRARLSNLQTGSAEQLYLVALIEDDESYVHGLLFNTRLRGEWFAVTPDATRILQSEYGLNIAPSPEPQPRIGSVTWADYLALVRMGAAPPSDWPRQVAA